MNISNLTDLATFWFYKAVMCLSLGDVRGSGYLVWRSHARLVVTSGRGGEDIVQQLYIFN